VRLKGGDPFVFGRGSEEVEFAESHGVQTAVVPGISSAFAVPASLNIPVTARGVSESIWVITGTTKSGEMSNDIKLAAQSTATVVIVMGLNKIEAIMGAFAQQGKGDVPVAVIQNGTLSNQRSVVGTVSSITSQAKEQNISAPAIIVVGEVVRYAQVLEQIAVSAKSIA
jgi:uroporphyrin-III C-methyltransferase